jgi:hypothetical protein
MPYDCKSNQIKTMNFIKKHFYLIGLLLLMTFGCRSCDTVDSGKVSSSAIYQDYSVSASSAGTEISATFRVGGPTGTTVNLNPPSRVEYNGTQMDENLRSAFSGTYYSASTRDLAARHQFLYTDGEGRIYKNEISFEAIGLADVPGTIKAGEKIVIPLTRRLADNENLDTMILSEEKRTGENSNTNANTSVPEKRYSVNLSRNLNGDRTAVEIPAESLVNFAAGKASLYISISGDVPIQEKTETGGSMHYSFNTASYSVTILPASK